MSDGGKWGGGGGGLALAFEEELLAGDLVVFDGVDGDFFERDLFAGGFGGDFVDEEDGELIGAVEEGAADFLVVEGFVGDPVLGFFDDGLLAGGFAAVAFDGDDVGRVERAHHVEIFALVAEVHELFGDGLEGHGGGSFAGIVPECNGESEKGTGGKLAMPRFRDFLIIP